MKAGIRNRLFRTVARVWRTITHKMLNRVYMAGRLRAIAARLAPVNDPEFDALRARHSGDRFLSPDDLTVTGVLPRRIVVIGSCLAEGLVRAFTVPVDFVLLNNSAQLPASPPAGPSAYDLQVIQLVTRAVVPDQALWHVPFDDLPGHERIFAECAGRLRHQLHAAARWCRDYSIPAFVTSFFVPLEPHTGLFMPRHDLRNPAWFITQLNAVLEQEAAAIPNLHVLDIDTLAAAFGKKTVNDHFVDTDSHGSLLGNGNYGKDRERIGFIHPLDRHYETNTDSFRRAFWHRVVTMYRILHQADAVKLVITDLDNTLWRGTVADEGVFEESTSEGWPAGFMEALSWLRKRGIVLAIASKNEESRIRSLWPAATGGRLSLEDFAVVKISWDSKIKSVGDILGTVNVLPRNTLFIDDNPAEREAVRAAFPGIRVLGKHPYYFKRILLWSSETQGTSISAESSRRTELVKARQEREAIRTQMTREAFLQTLAVETDIFTVTGPDDPKYNRLFELINKTNQFNTTGRRWTAREMAAFLAAGGQLAGFAARDRYSDYGIIGAVLVSGAEIEQFVMSCRVIGLDIETRVLDFVRTVPGVAGQPVLAARFVETEANFPCRDLYSRHGFENSGDGWHLRL